MLDAGMRAGLTFSFDFGFSARRRAYTVSTWARASSMVRPSARRPFTKSHRRPRLRMRGTSGWSSVLDWMPAKLSRSTIISGVQNSGTTPGRVPEKLRGATPMIV